MVYRPAQVYNGSGWDDVGDKRIGAENGDIPQASVANLTSDLASKLDLAGGKILQIVRATDSTNRTTTSTSYVDVTGMSVTITPQKNDSAVLVMATFSSSTTASSGNDLLGFLQLTDNSDNALLNAEGVPIALSGYTNPGTVFVFGPTVLLGYSTPATTSATTYKMRFKSQQATTTTRVSNATATGQMLAIEVSA